MSKRDLYDVLGVARDADRATIQKAYRLLARQSHPDVNPGDTAAEERFKEISKAWQVLGDPESRRVYDEFGEVSLEAGFDAEQARKAREAFGTRFGFEGRPDPSGYAQEFQFGDLEDLFGGVFGRTREGRGMPMRGPDLEASLVLDFVEAVRGGEKRLSLSRPTTEGENVSETLTVTVPPGVDTGARLRLAGKGAPGRSGGPPGDLFVRLRVRPHRVFRREGAKNLTFDLPISVREAVQGAQISVPTLDGRVTLTVPPGTDSGSRLRLRGKGAPAPGGGAAGDLFAIIQIRVPPNLDDASRASLDALERFEDPEIREELSP